MKHNEKAVIEDEIEDLKLKREYLKGYLNGFRDSEELNGNGNGNKKKRGGDNGIE